MGFYLMHGPGPNFSRQGTDHYHLRVYIEAKNMSISGKYYYAHTVTTNLN